jgi:DNA-binding MarR family transcriptional regulator
MIPYGCGVTKVSAGLDPALEWERLLAKVGTAVARRHHRILADHGLTPTSMGLLQALDHREGLSHRDLAAQLGLTPATLTPVVDVLEETGSIRRARDRRDRRVVRLSITSTGRDRIREAAASASAAMRRCLPEPAPEHADLVRGYLLYVLAAMEERPDPQ